MKAWIIAAAGAALLTASCTTASGGGALPMAAYAAAAADPARPAADRERDALRKPVEMLAFAEVRPGQQVLDVIPGQGYFTRLLAHAVGPGGKVYAYVPTEIAGQFESKANADKLAAAMANVEAASDPLLQHAPEPFADLVWTAQNYHDFRLDYFGKPDPVAVNRAIFSTLKPGGLFVVVDHSAAAGSGARDAGTLHRIDKEQVKREVIAAGFEFVGESTVLANPADPRTANVFDPAIRGRTDQFALKFRRPR
jgi:predicted methyltransferase